MSFIMKKKKSFLKYNIYYTFLPYFYLCNDFIISLSFTYSQQIRKKKQTEKWIESTIFVSSDYIMSCFPYLIRKEDEEEAVMNYKEK